jgi:hypothetical protein
MKKIIFGLMVLIGFSFIGCDNGTTSNGNDSNTETITIEKLSIKDNSIKSLYISSISINSNARAVSDSTIQTLSYLNSNGENTPFFFTSPSGKNIILSISNLQQLDEKKILVDFTSFYEITSNENVYTIGGTIFNTGRALIDMESGKVYDFKEYNNIQLASNDLVFVIKNDIIYKIDLNNISVAVPLNNPTYNPVINIEPPCIISNKILGETYNTLADCYLLDINNSFPIKKISYSQENQGDLIDLSPYTGDNLIQDLSGSTWYFVGSNDSYSICKVLINNEGVFSIAEKTTNTLAFQGYYESNIFYLDSGNYGRVKKIGFNYKLRYKNNGIIIFSPDGFVSLKKKIDGIQIESTALSMPTLNVDACFINKDNYLYYLEGTSIKRLYLASGSSPELVYSNNKILTSSLREDILTASGNNLIFYQFADDNVSVNTYSLAMYQQGATPKLLSTNSAEIKNIVELDF